MATKKQMAPGTLYGVRFMSDEGPSNYAWYKSIEELINDCKSGDIDADDEDIRVLEYGLLGVHTVKRTVFLEKVSK